MHAPTSCTPESWGLKFTVKVYSLTCPSQTAWPTPAIKQVPASLLTMSPPTSGNFITSDGLIRRGLSGEAGWDQDSGPQPRTEALRVRSPDASASPGTCQKCTPSGSTTDGLNRKTRGRALRPYPACSGLRGTGLAQWNLPALFGNEDGSVLVTRMSSWRDALT